MNVKDVRDVCSYQWDYPPKARRYEPFWRLVDEPWQPDQFDRLGFAAYVLGGRAEIASEADPGGSDACLWDEPIERWLGEFLRFRTAVANG
jgi:hypothetical protein